MNAPSSAMPTEVRPSPLVSIVMPCFNAAQYLERSVGSVLKQTLPAWELIIVDDGSTDDSWPRLVQMAGRDPRIRVIRQQNSGAAAARNRALREITSPYIAFLDADDTWHPEFLATMLEALTQRPEVGLAYCGWQNVGLGGGRDAPFIPPDYENDRKIEAMLEGCRWPINAVLVRSSVVQMANGFDEALSSCMDYDLWLRIATTHTLVRVPRVLAFYHHDPASNQITRDRARIALNHWRAQRKYLRANAAVAKRLGRERVRSLTLGELLRRGYESYWQRDLRSARTIFRAVMRHGYGTLRDWKYMLPALLPERLHCWLIELADHGKT